MIRSSWLALRVLGIVAVSCAVELLLLAAVGSEVTSVAQLGTARDNPVASAAAAESALRAVASTVALVAWTRWCLALTETLIALASERAHSADADADADVAADAGVDGGRLVRRSTAVLLILGLSAVGAAAPAAAAGWDELRGPRLDGLRLPDLPAARMPGAGTPTGGALCQPGSVVVAPGDSLWTIAAEQLAAEGSDPTARAIDRSWPRWHAHNRDVIGPDPDQLLPGQRLQHPLPDPCLRRTVQ